MKLSGAVPGSTTTFTPSTGVANWILESTSTTQIVAVQEVAFGGELTSSTAMRTRIARDSAVGTGARTAGSVQRVDQTLTSAGNAAFFSTTYANSQPTIVAGALRQFSWNANGGFIRWLAAPGEEFLINVAASIECRQDIGTGQSSYDCLWSEF